MARSTKHYWLITGIFLAVGLFVGFVLGGAFKPSLGISAFCAIFLARNLFETKHLSYESTYPIIEGIFDGTAAMILFFFIRTFLLK